MKFNEGYNNRIHIMEQIANRENSQQRFRKASLQRRKIMEENLNSFRKTMTNFSSSKTQNIAPFNTASVIAEIPRDKKLSVDNQQGIYPKETIKSPTFKEIHYEKDVEQFTTENFQNRKVKQVQFHDQQQANTVQIIDSQGLNDSVHGQVIHYDNQNKVNKIIGENNSSTSALFFTSQFNQFLQNNHNLQNENQHKMQVKTLSKQQLENITSKIKQEIVQKHQQQNNTQQKISQHISNQNYHTKGVDINNQNYHTKVVENHVQFDQFGNKSESMRQQQFQKQSRMLINNKSGNSIALSNQSSLKYSLYESNIKDIFNSKITNELIALPNHFRQNQQEKLYHQIKIKILSDNLLARQYRIQIKQFIHFSKINSFSNNVLKRYKKQIFDSFIINKELNFEQRKNQIKCDNYLKVKLQTNILDIFNAFKYLYKEKLQKYRQADSFRQNEQFKLKQNIFRHFKISWFNQKVKRQVELYYLSKLFSHFSKVIKAQKQMQRNKCLGHYCRNIKRRFFEHLKEGVQKLQTQRIQRDNAKWHFAFKLQKKVFQAWKQKLAYKDRYISLAMTTKNTFKQTADQKWLQIKTVDFRQIK